MGEFYGVVGCRHHPWGVGDRLAAQADREAHDVDVAAAATIAVAMAKEHYFFQLIPPHPTFPHDMTDEERLLMEEHGRYFQEQFTDGKVLLFGPAMARGGAFGLAVLEVHNEAEARRFGECDPSVRAGLNRFEFYPMRVSATRAKEQ